MAEAEALDSGLQLVELADAQFVMDKSTRVVPTIVAPIEFSEKSRSMYFLS